MAGGHMADDWRLDGDKASYLTDATVVRKHYRAKSPTSEHEHCEFCWAKFMDPEFSDEHKRFIEENPDVQTTGYGVQASGPDGQDDYRWICEDCFRDFREQFRWKVIGR
jgi:hypothetical protein